MAEITLKNLRKQYGKTEIIRGIDCVIEDGEFLVVVGPSGCGKSTLLRMIAGLETVSDGEITIDGERVNEREPADRDIAMVFQNYALYPHMSVFDNMAYGLKNRGIDKAEIARKVQRSAEVLGLQDLLTRRPRQLSGGQRQRVAMGRAIVREPKVFLFDEPLSNLDAKLRVQMRIELKKLHDELNITSVYVTHDQIEAMTLGHRLLVMSDGRAEQIGKPLTLYQRPQTTFVAGFIGSPAMNLFLARRHASGVLELPGGTVTSIGAPANGGDEFIVGIRPENLHTIDNSSPDQVDLQIDVDLIEELGIETMVHGHICGITEVVPLTVRLSGSAPVSGHGPVSLRLDRDQVHCFAADSKIRL